MVQLPLVLLVLPATLRLLLITKPSGDEASMR